jgi:hypothetical protein
MGTTEFFAIISDSKPNALVVDLFIYYRFVNPFNQG